MGEALLLSTFYILVILFLYSSGVISEQVKQMMTCEGTIT